MTRIAVTPELLEKLNPLASELADNGLHLLAEAEVAETRPDCLLIEPQHRELLCSPVRRWPALVLAEPGNISEAVQSIKAGATDYLTLPLSADVLAAAVERALAEWALQEPLISQARSGFEIVGASPAIRELTRRIEMASANDSPVLILGESGTGKELAARALHALSRRRQTPLLTLNCAAIPAAMIEAELFGKAGSSAEDPKIGLLQAAEGGTVFLDEIGALPEACQARLLQVLEAGTLRATGSSERHPSNVRLLAASHQALEPLAEQGRFRKDLLYRLNAFPILIPPLRERGDDIKTLAERFLHSTAQRLGKSGLSFSAAALASLRDYPWPGNVRELENAVERAVILCKGNEIEASELAIETPEFRGSPRAASDVEAGLAVTIATAKSGSADENTSLETYFLNFVLEHQDQLTETELAERLGISRKSLWERRQRLNIPRKRTRKRGPRRDRA